MTGLSGCVVPLERMYSDGYGFPKHARLLGSQDFGAVFQKTDFKLNGPCALLLVKHNSQHARLGMVIAKKNVRHASQRNRLKRLIRESFRLNLHRLPNVDIVFLARRGLELRSNEEIRTDLDTLWQRLRKKSNQV